VECIAVPHFDNTDQMMEATVNAVRPLGLRPGDRIVITAGLPFGSSGTTNLIRVLEVTE
jgi:pyruvate kinase